jgi:catechol 2,3-dioxygenase-like lactoylglutathione lyase family enzyme
MSRTRFQALHPVIPVRDVNAAITYYTAKLGFETSFQDDEAEPRYAGVRRDGVEVHLQWHEPATFRSGVDTVSLRFLVADVDELFDEYADKGVFHDRTALRDTPWGTREFAFYDSDGNGLFFYRDLP